MTILLQSLIQDAARQLGDVACRDGNHTWGSDGGRCCPKGWEDCSQTVYVCKVCGAEDYGDRKSSPAYKECFVKCDREENDYGFY